MIVLTYHKINNAKNFKAQINYLKNNHEVIKPELFFSKIRQESGFNKKDVLITFDDGDVSVLNNALPILQEYECPAILFVITSLINSTVPFWWDIVLKYVGSSNKLNVLKKISNTDRLHFMQELELKNGKYEYPQLTIEELRYLERNNIFIGNHSHTHPMLDQCTEGEIVEELRASRFFFETNGLSGYSFFAYPNGNFNKWVEDILKREGIDCAFIFDHKINRVALNQMRISRLSVDDNIPLWKFRLILSGWHTYLAPISKFIYNLFH